MAVGLRRDAAFALRTGKPDDIGQLEHLRPGPELANQWVRAEAKLSPGSVDYRRPFEAAVFRLFPVASGAPVFVQVQVPEGGEFVMPSSFVGRLVPLEQLGIYHQGLKAALASRFGSAENAWVLLDGDAPSSQRWALGLALLCLSFSAFSLLSFIALFWPSVPTSHEQRETQEA